LTYSSYNVLKIASGTLVGGASGAAETGTKTLFIRTFQRLGHHMFPEIQTSQGQGLISITVT
jgi:hypothetical protein